MQYIVQARSTISNRMVYVKLIDYGENALPIEERFTFMEGNIEEVNNIADCDLLDLETAETIINFIDQMKEKYEQNPDDGEMWIRDWKILEI